MTRLAKLLLPYCETEAAAALIADELSQKGVFVSHTNGSFTCKFEPNSVFGTMTMDGETFEVYLGNIRTEALGMGRDPFTLKMIAPIGYKRQITLIER